MKDRLVRFAFALCLFPPTLALAHTGVAPANGFISGLAHPVGGPDHILAMLATGIWATQMGRRFIWAAPLAFVSVMALGGALGISGISIPFSEGGIAVSVLALGILIAAAVKLPLAASVVIAGLFGIFHGHAHGAGMPLGVSGIAYGLGLILSTASLHLCGIGFGHLMRRVSRPALVRVAGAAIASFGGYSCLVA
ncbi:MAG: HupE/UreJ family protein [Nitrosomonadales bacterium]|nr:HupE/UreJ family protein [Nitrosomonadales bacterium]